MRFKTRPELSLLFDAISAKIGHAAFVRAVKSNDFKRSISMTVKELGELRRRLRPDKNAISRIYGCYVNSSREIISYLDESLGTMPQDESEKYLSLLKKGLSGGLGRNLIDIVFSTAQVMDSDEHRLLTALRDSELKDAEARNRFYQTVIDSLEMEDCNYLILLVYDRYDVPYRAKDGERQEDAAEVYSYLLCSICPVKQTKPALSYHVRENEFHNRRADWLVSPPELGFLFPAFDDRSTNLYNALYYTRDSGENHPELVEAVFRREAPMPAAAQKETFQTLLSDTLADECSCEVVQAVHDQLCELVEEHRERKEAEPLTLSKGAVKCVLKSCGVSDSHVEEFALRYDDAFGADMALSPRNLVEKQIEVCTPDVVIKVSPERSDLVDTRVIDGVKYILIRADEGVEVNGVPVHIAK